MCLKKHWKCVNIKQIRIDNCQKFWSFECWKLWISETWNDWSFECLKRWIFKALLKIVNCMKFDFFTPGVHFRSRQCDNPRPAYGGSNCLGDGEDFRLCNIESCPAAVDFRALQCKHLFEGNFHIFEIEIKLKRS